MFHNLPTWAENYIHILYNNHFRYGTPVEQISLCRFQIRTKYEHFEAWPLLKNKNTQPQVNFSGNYKKRLYLHTATKTVTEKNFIP